MTWYFLYHAHYRFYHFFRVLNFERRVTRVVCTQLNQLIRANELFDNQLTEPQQSVPGRLVTHHTHSHFCSFFFSVHINRSEPLGAQSHTHTSGGSIQRRKARRGSWSRCMDVIFPYTWTIRRMTSGAAVNLTRSVSIIWTHQVCPPWAGRITVEDLPSAIIITRVIT